MPEKAMNSDWERAKALLTGDIVCALVRGEEVLTSTERGIAPLVKWLGSGRDFFGFSAADKIVGRAAAFCYLRMGVSAVYGEVMAGEAAALLASRKVAAACAVTTEKIVNRRGDGPCPMEEAVKGISSPSEAVEALKKKLGSMQ